MITAKQWWLGDWQAGQLTQLRLFDMTTAGTHGLQQTILQSPHAPLSLLSHLPDEIYHVEGLPPVTGVTRRQLLARKLAQVAPRTQYHRVCQLEPVNAATLPVQYLFCALTPPALVQACLDWCQQQGVWVSVLSMQSLLMPAWVRAYVPQRRHVLLMVPIEHDIRLSYHQHGQLFFSRLLNIEGLGAAAKITPAVLVSLAIEIAHTFQYVQSKQWMREEDVLCVLYSVATTGTPVDALQAAFRVALDQVRLAHAELVMLPIDDLLHRLQLPQATTGREQADHEPAGDVDVARPADADPILYAVLATLLASHPQSGLTCDGLRLHATLITAKRWLRGVCLGLLGVGSLLTWQLATVWRPDAMHMRPSLVMAEFSSAPPVAKPFQALSQLQQVLAIDRVLFAAQRHPAATLQQLNTLLGPHQAWHIQHLHWAWGPAPALAKPLAPKPSSAHLTEQSLNGASGRASASSLHLSDWQMFVRVRLQLSAGADPQAARADWHAILRLLQQSAWVDHHEVLHAGAASEGIQGDTRQAYALPTQAEILLWLK